MEELEELKQEAEEVLCEQENKEIAPEEPEAAEPAPADFLEKYASAAFHDLAVKRGSGDKEAADKIRRYIRHIEKKDAKSVEKYLRTPNENKNLEALRKSYSKMQALSWVCLILCAIATFAVIGLVVFKSELLQNRLYQGIICGAAVLFAALTWIFSGIGGSKAQRMTELDLLLRVKDIPSEDVEQTEDAVEEAEAEIENTEDAIEEKVEEAE